MFLFARLFGVITFFVALFVAYILVLNAKNKKKIKYILCFYLVVLFFMAYFYLPYKTADLYYINSLITNSYANLSFEQIFNVFQNSNYHLFRIYYWIFGQIGNLHLLPAVTALIFHLNIFYIIYSSSIKYNFSSRTTANMLLFFMGAGQFLEVISGIKSMLAFSIIAVCVYREFIQNKSFFKNIPLYIIAALMHDAAFVLVGLRVIFLFIQHEKRLIYKILNIIVLFVIVIILMRYGNDIIDNIINHSSAYIGGDVYSNNWEYLIGFILNIFMIYSLRKYKLISKSGEGSITLKGNNLYRMVLVMIIINVIFSFEYSIFHRFSTYTLMLFLPLLGELLEEKKKKNRFLKKYNTIFTLTIFIVFSICLTRGNLSSLKFFE